jgi:hypothetical protein
MHVTGWIPLVGSDVPAGRCVQDSLQREPLASLRFELPPLLPILSPSDIDSPVDDIYHAFNEACKTIMKTVGAALGFNSRWWNDECKAAAQVLRFAKRCPTWTRIVWMQLLMTQLWSSDTRYSNTRSTLYVRRRRSTSTNIDKR